MFKTVFVTVINTWQARKASDHPDVAPKGNFQAFLQILDYGESTKGLCLKTFFATVINTW